MWRKKYRPINDSNPYPIQKILSRVLHARLQYGKLTLAPAVQLLLYYFIYPDLSSGIYRLPLLRSNRLQLFYSVLLHARHFSLVVACDSHLARDPCSGAALEALI